MVGEWRGMVADHVVEWFYVGFVGLLALLALLTLMALLAVKAT